MAKHRSAMGWVDPSSPTQEWDRASCVRLARRLGFELSWADLGSPLDLVEQIEAAGVEVVMVPNTAHVTAWDLARLTLFADLEAAAPRESFPRHGHGGVARVQR